MIGQTEIEDLEENMLNCPELSCFMGASSKSDENESTSEEEAEKQKRKAIAMLDQLFKGVPASEILKKVKLLQERKLLHLREEVNNLQIKDARLHTRIIVEEQQLRKVKREFGQIKSSYLKDYRGSQIQMRKTIAEKEQKVALLEAFAGVEKVLDKALEEKLFNIEKIPVKPMAEGQECTDGNEAKALMVPTRRSNFKQKTEWIEFLQENSHFIFKIKTQEDRKLALRIALRHITSSDPDLDTISKSYKFQDLATVLLSSPYLDTSRQLSTRQGSSSQQETFDDPNLRSTAQESEPFSERKLGANIGNASAKKNSPTQASMLHEEEDPKWGPVNYGVRLLVEDVVIPMASNLAEVPLLQLYEEELFCSSFDLSKLLDLLRSIRPECEKIEYKEKL